MYAIRSYYEGYKNYDGYACYAKTFKLSNELNGKDVVLLLGKIDDFDQVYINGKLIAQHGQWREDVVITSYSIHYTKLYEARYVQKFQF